MPDMYIDADAAVAIGVNLMPLLDDTDFKTRETGIVYNQAGMDLVWNFTTSAGVVTQTAVTPTTAGDYDWTHVGDGIYKIEIPASGGASINNDTEGSGFFTGICTGVLPWRSPVYVFRAAGLNNLLIDDAHSATRGLSGTALPAAAADGAGGLPISDAGGLDMDNVHYRAKLSSYIGPFGIGVYVDSGAANTNTVFGTDGTFDNPVSTPAAAKTIADAMGINRLYLEGNSDTTLVATMTDWEFCGIGALSDNILNFGSQDVSRSKFCNLTLEGTQGGADRIEAIDCGLQDPGAGVSTFHINGLRCGIVDDITLDTSNDNVLVDSFSLVAGGSAPIVRASGAAGTLIMNGHKGGVDLRDLSASHNLTVNILGGQCIFDASCNVNATVQLRGIGTKTDNTAGMSNLTETAFINMDKINTECDTALSDYAPNTVVPDAAGTAPTLTEIVNGVHDEVLTGATHNVVDSHARRVRNLQEFGTYEGGAIFIDTINGAVGTTDYESGTYMNPVDSIADANTIAASLTISRFAISSGTSLAFVASQDNQDFYGNSWTLALGGQSISASHIQGATISGVCTGASAPEFHECFVNAVTVSPSIFKFCDIQGVVTLPVGTVHFHRCAGESGGSLDYGAAVANTTVTWTDFSGELVISNLGANGTDILNIRGHGKITFDSTCVGGTVNWDGHFTLTDNSTTSPTFNSDDISSNVETLITQIGIAGAGLTDLGGMSTGMKAEVNAEADTANTDYGALKGGTAMTESYATDGAEFTPEQALYQIWQFLSEFSISGTTYTVKGLDGSTTKMTFTLDDGTTPTAIDRAT